MKKQIGICNFCKEEKNYAFHILFLNPSMKM